ncbi:MAG: DMT family transporter [Ginsengibacter sp.]
MTLQTRAHIGLLATNLFFAINLSAIKYFTGHHFAEPYGLNVVRIGVSVMLFWILFLFRGEKQKIRRSDVGRFLLCSLTALAINQMLFMKGLSYTWSIHASLLLLISPILITVVASWLLKEKITTFRIAGLLLGITGALILVSGGDNSGSGNNVIKGDILVILSTVSYTLYFILVKPLMKNYDPLDVMRWVFTFGLVMILPLGWSELTNITWPLFGFRDYLLLFILIVPGTFLAYVFNAYGIKNLGASIAGAYIYSQPVFAVMIAMIFLKEHLEPYKIAGGIIIFCGVYLADKKSLKNL